MTDSETDTDACNANDWMDQLRSFRHCCLLWKNTVDRENIIHWANEMLTRGTYSFFNLYVGREPEHAAGTFGKKSDDQQPFVIAFCTNDDAIAVQFRLTFPELDWGSELA